MAHEQRRGFSRHHPLHVTLKLRRELGTLRTTERAAVVRRAMTAGCIRDGFRIIDWSIQDDHLHMIIEARDATSLSRGVQGLRVRVAHGLNELLGRSGSVFVDRYHVQVLRTPRQVRNARAYVMNNARKHAAQKCEVMDEGWIDPFSSWAWFDGWRDNIETRQPAARATKAPVAPAPTWVLNCGWRRHGLIEVDEIPRLRLK